MLDLAGALFIKRDELENAANPLARFDWAKETELVTAIINAHLDPIGMRQIGLGTEHRHERERQEPMRNCLAKGRHLRHFWVNMDELMITRRISEFVDHLLIDKNPFGCADYGAHHCLHFV